MRLLALETSTRRLSLALWQDGRLLERGEDRPNGGSERVLPWVQELLAEAGMTLAQLDGIAFGAGPGSFTGLRLACGVAQGLAFGADLPVVPVSCLQALAVASGKPRVWACVDARMNEMYAAAYVLGGEVLSAAQEPVCVSPEAACPPDGAGWWGAGDAFSSYGKTLERHAPTLQGVLADCFPTAAAVARLAAPIIERNGGVTAAEAHPLYVRDKVALTTAERLARGGVR